MRWRNPMQKEKNIGKLYLYTLRSDAHFFGSYFRPRYGVGPWHTESKEKGAAECLGGCLGESRPTTIKMQHIMTRTPSFFYRIPILWTVLMMIPIMGHATRDGV
jgi:hypothetical protein